MSYTVQVTPNKLFQGQFCGNGKFPLITASKENWNDRILCYSGDERNDFVLEDLDPSLCTHMVYMSAEIIEVEGGWGIGPMGGSEEIDYYIRYNNFTMAHPRLKVSTVSL